MKSSPAPGSPAIPLRRLASSVLVVLFLLAGVAAPKARAAEPKTHTLFMGADFSVEYHKQLYRVHDIEGGSFVITVDGKDVKVPANWGSVKVKVDRALKLSGTSVVVDHLTAERAYTPGNDPVKKFMSQQSEVAAAEDAAASAASFNATAQSMGNAEAHASKGSEPGMASIYGDPMVTERQFNRTAGSGLSAMGRDTSRQGNMQDELQKELFDAIDVEFVLSSPKPLRRPFVMILAEYHTAEGGPGEEFNWLYATAIDPVDTRARKIRIRQGGFPPGYQMDRSQVHVYDGGQEVATSVGEKQVPLTRSEAFAYLLLDYLGTHKGATLPATPALGKLTAEANTRLSTDEQKETFYVKVSKDGLPVAAFADAGFAHPVDENVAALVANVRFYPALDNGKTVEGVAELKFSRLAL